MAVTVSGTSITFNDATVQTTAAGAPTTAQVLNATASASFNTVGTYATLVTNGGNIGTLAPGNNFAGSNLRYQTLTWQACPGQYVVSGQTAVSGTWKCMGFTASTLGLFLRIS